MGFIFGHTNGKAETYMDRWTDRRGSTWTGGQTDVEVEIVI